MSGHVLVVDDDLKVVRLVCRALGRAGFDVASASTGADAVRMMEDEPAAVVLDVDLPDADGRTLLERFRVEWPDVSIVMFTAFGDVEQAVECMQRGACDFVQKPFQPPRMVASVRNAVTQWRLRVRVQTLARELKEERGFSAILSAAPSMRRPLELLKRAAANDVTVLVEGESGTGKELAARAVHAESPRHDGPFVSFKCGAVPEGVVEAELFGRERSLLPGAAVEHKGVFERADGGTLFLDEVAELRPDLQVRILRVLQERAVTRIDGIMPRRLDVRLVAASRLDLRAEMRSGRLREDVYYRIAVFPVTLPPLKDREGDVPLLAHAFLAQFAQRHGRQVNGFTAEALAALTSYEWPGNVRELENAVERAVLVEDGAAVSLASLPDAVVCAVERSATSLVRAAEAATFLRAVPAAPAPADSEILPLEELERQAIVHALESTGGDVSAAAARLGVGRATIYRRAERYRYRQTAM